MLEFIEYTNDQIRIRLPKQLRQQRPPQSFHGNLFFCGNLVRSEPETQVKVIIDPNLHEGQTKAYLESVERPPEFVPVGPIRYKVLRWGPCNFGEGGQEILASSEILDKGYLFYTWQAIYSMQGRYVKLIITGGGSREDFETVASVVRHI